MTMMYAAPAAVRQDRVLSMRDWSGQNVVIVGAARQGIALARYLAQHGALITLNDRRTATELQAAQEDLADLPIHWRLGEHPLSLLDRADLLCLSGGVPLTLPLVVEARRRGIPLSNDSQLFLEAAPCRTIGITGSAGKTTTTTLVGRAAQASLRHAQEPARPGESGSSAIQPGRRVWVGGNIGSPLIAVVDEMRTEDLAVMELSSFQLELMDRSPQVAAVLNITPNHLDRHGTMQAYREAKARILDFQSPEDVAVLNRDDPGSWSLATRVKGRLLSFGLDEPAPGLEGTFLRGEELCLRKNESGRLAEIALMRRSGIGLRGEHNLVNVLAAGAIAAAAGFPAGALAEAVQGFRGVPHRLEFVRTWGGAEWYNDSIATAPERAMAAIRSFDEPLVLLAGGRDKDLPWGDFAALVRQRVDHLIVFGEAAGKILEALEAAPVPAERRDGLTVQRCKGLREALQAASQIVQPGDVVLLAPGGTSFDEFHDFEERGECFVNWVRELP
jgi:UDP-N-acetylmuramoylalanine--D-glutamate ligase